MSDKTDLTHEKSKIVNGMPASPGIGAGKPWIFPRKGASVQPEKISDNQTESEITHFNQAVEKIENQFRQMADEADDTEIKKIIESQLLVLHDPELHKSVIRKIKKEHFTAVFSIFDALNEYITMLESADAVWARERTIDIVSIRDQLVMAVQQKEQEEFQLDGSVVFAAELSPTEMISLSRSKISGIVLHKGGLTSHAVILAQSLGIPCVVGVNWSKLNPNQHEHVILDGDQGEVVFSPDSAMQKKIDERGIRQEKVRKEALKWAGLPSETKCGHKFTIRANVEFENELPRIKTHGADGVGLLRTETLLLRAKDFDVKEQIAFYKKVLASADNKPVIIRLFDAGGDKLLDNYETEANPFLGWRGVRMLLDEQKLLEQQVEAIVRVSADYKGEVKIMVPMISTLTEVDRMKDVVESVKEKLIKDGVITDVHIPFGIMVEVPAVAMMANEFAKKVDFFSIGTNDLTQYTLAVDRGNEKISKLFRPSHPAIWRMIKLIKEGADSASIPVSVCGEMASVSEYAACFIGMGINELSMTTNQIPMVKMALRKSELKNLEKLAEDVCSSGSVKETEEIFSNWKKQRV